MDNDLRTWFNILVSQTSHMLGNLYNKFVISFAFLLLVSLLLLLLSFVCSFIAQGSVYLKLMPAESPIGQIQLLMQGMTPNWGFSIISPLAQVSHIYLKLDSFKSLAFKEDIWVCDYANDPTSIVGNQEKLVIIGVSPLLFSTIN